MKFIISVLVKVFVYIILYHMWKKTISKSLLLIAVFVLSSWVSSQCFAQTDVMSQLDSLTSFLWITQSGNIQTDNTQSDTTQTYTYKNADWTTPLWRQTLNNLRKKWYTDSEIKQALEDAWLDWSAYFKTESKNTASQTTAWTTPLWRQTLNNLRKKWYSDSEIKQALEDAWLDWSAYFGAESKSDYSFPHGQNSVYTSRSCKTYNIEYVDLLWAYTSPNLLSKEYFVNQDYFKRYIDSKNKQISWCPTNIWRISTSYLDKSDSDDQFIAPNGKIYFIQRNDNWYFESNELKTTKSFVSLSELKHYIRDRNPLIWM